MSAEKKKLKYQTKNCSESNNMGVVISICLQTKSYLFKERGVDD